MSDSYTTTSRQGYGSSILNSLGGALFGVALFLAAFVVLFWNEGRAVHRAKALKEGAALTVEVSDPSRVNPEDQGKLVHLIGPAKGQILRDSDFGISLDAVTLRRVVEMYQWKEEKHQETQRDTVGGGHTTTTTYTYSGAWSDKLIRSSEFNHPQGHENPPKPVESASWTADPATIGAYALVPSLTSKIDDFKPYPATEAMRATLTASAPSAIETSDRRSDSNLSPPQSDGDSAPPHASSASWGDGFIARLLLHAQVIDGAFYVGPNGQAAEVNRPRIGDARITWNVIHSGEVVSVIAAQSGNNLLAFQTSNRDTIELLSIGAHDSGEMFKAEQQRNSQLAWILRGVGFAMMFISICMVLAPLKTVVGVVGILGDLVGMGVGLVAFAFSLIASSITIAIAWVFYRPLLGIGCCW